MYCSLVAIIETDLKSSTVVWKMKPCESISLERKVPQYSEHFHHPSIMYSTLWSWCASWWSQPRHHYRSIYYGRLGSRGTVGSIVYSGSYLKPFGTRCPRSFLTYQLSRVFTRRSQKNVGHKCLSTITMSLWSVTTTTAKFLFVAFVQIGMFCTDASNFGGKEKSTELE